MAKRINKHSEDIDKLLARLGGGQNPKKLLSVDETAEGLTDCYVNGLTLLDDARLLAANDREPRALSLTILALEELAKVPDLDELYLDPRTRTDADAWTDFWKRFSQHKPKQKRIAAYGNILRDSASLEEAIFENSTPYANYLSEHAYGHLDNVKQRNFYVDFSGTRFRRPENKKDVSRALDLLFAFAEERADSFGSWHITAQRSVDFLTARLKAFSSYTGELSDLLKHIHSFNDWASSHSPIETQADLMRLLCYHSSAMVPDYASFLPACESFLSKKIEQERIELLGHAVTSLKLRMAIEALPGSRQRASLMFRLLFSYSTRHLSDEDSKELFGVSPSENARQHFR